MKSKCWLGALFVFLWLGAGACTTSPSVSTGAPDASWSDAGSARDAAMRDSASSDAGMTANAHDAGSPADASAHDAARAVDSGSGPMDSVDAGSGMDAGTGAHDAGSNHDAGGSTTPQDAGPLTTVTFQQGVNGYSGTKSVGISDYAGLGSPGQWNANGATFADGENDWCTGINIPYAPAYTEYWLIRFDDLNLPSGAQVVNAKLTIHAFANDVDGNVFLIGRYLNAAWDGNTPTSCAGCSNALVGFRYRDGSAHPWAALGASAEGSDLIENKSFRLPESGFFPLGHTPAVFESQLDPAVVQSWANGQNYGMRIVTGVTGIHVSFVQPVRDPAERPIGSRPLLTISYATP